jgi:hypothetical protein
MNISTAWKVFLRKKKKRRSHDEPYHGDRFPYHPSIGRKSFRHVDEPESPGGPWFEVERLIFNPSVDGLFYSLVKHQGSLHPHYGRFIRIERPNRFEHTWMSEGTRGAESVVNITLEPRGDNTEFTIRHSGLPDDELGRPYWTECSSQRTTTLSTGMRSVFAIWARSSCDCAEWVQTVTMPLLGNVGEGNKRTNRSLFDEPLLISCRDRLGRPCLNAESG